MNGGDEENRRLHTALKVSSFNLTFSFSLQPSQ